MKKLLLATAFISAFAYPVYATTPPNISQTMGVCDPNFPLRCIKPNTDGSINTVGGGGGGGAVTVADGADIAQGSTTDAACATDNGTCTVEAMQKRIAQRLTTLNGTLGSPFQAGGSIGNTAFGATQSGPWLNGVKGADGATISTAANLFPVGTDGVTDGAVFSNAGVTSATTLVTLNTAGYGYLEFQTPSVGSGNVIGVDASCDGTPGTGSTFVGSQFWRQDASTQAPNTVTSPLATVNYVAPVTCPTMRIRVSTYSSGTVSMFGAQKRGSAPTPPIAQVSLALQGNLSSSAAGASATATQLISASYNRLFNGTTWDPARVITAADGTGLGVAGVAVAPHSSVNGAISNTGPSGNGPVYNASNLVVCSAACNGYKVEVVSLASAGYVMVFDATTKPADGAVTPAVCMPVAVTTGLTLPLGQADIPMRFTTGETVVFSTGANCRTLAAASADMIRGLSK